MQQNEIIPLINIHVHNPVNVTGIKTITNHCIELNRPQILSEGFYSLGLHPWHINDFLAIYSENEIFNLIQQRLDVLLHANKDIVFWGEIGLDKAIELPIDVQTRFFIFQLQLAANYNLPIVIHCVKAYNEVIQYLSDIKYCIPVVFHGFRGSVDLAKNLVRSGYYISLGWQLMQNNKLLFINLLHSIPIDKVFFETDIFPNELIVDVYAEAQLQTGIDYRSIIGKTYNNISSLRGDF